MAKQKTAYRALDAWAFVKGDATQENIANVSRTMRENWKHIGKNLTVRTYKRDIRAGGATVDCVVVVARQKVPLCMTCGKRPAQPSNGGMTCDSCATS